MRGLFTLLFWWFGGKCKNCRFWENKWGEKGTDEGICNIHDYYVHTVTAKYDYVRTWNDFGCNQWRKK